MLQFNWDTLPNSRILQQKTGPIASIFSPSNAPITISRAPVRCVNLGCKAIANKWCSIDRKAKSWVCSICETKNTWNGDEVPSELSYDAIELTSKQENSASPSLYIFLIDLHNEVRAICDAVRETLTVLPKNSSVSIVPFTDVPVRIRKQTTFDKPDFFRVDVPAELDELSKILGCLKEDVRIVEKGKRPPRALGKALEYAIQLEKAFGLNETKLEQDFESLSLDSPLKAHFDMKAMGKHRVHIITIISGPPTLGAGSVANESVKEPLRHQEASISAVTRSSQASEYYTTLLTKSKAIFSVFDGSVSESGLFEMLRLCTKSGGTIVQSETFEMNYFKQNLMKWCSQNGYLGSLTVKTSANWRVSGAIGPVISRKDHSQYALDECIGEGLTGSWDLRFLGMHGGVTVFFSIHEVSKKAFYGQIILKSAGCWKVLSFKKYGSCEKNEVGSGFNDSVFLAIYAKAMAWERIRALESDKKKKLKQIDETLKKLIYFGKSGGTFSSFRNAVLDVFAARNGLPILSNEFMKMPEMIYFLRRSFLGDSYNTSPDEIGFISNCLLRSNVDYSVLIVVPKVMRVEENKLKSLPLSSEILADNSDGVLILDTLFKVLIHYGSTLCYHRDWFKTNIGAAFLEQNSSEWDLEGDIKGIIAQNREKIQQFAEDKVDFAKLFGEIQFARQYAFALIGTPGRPVLSRFIESDEGKSQARFLYANLSPSDSYNNEYGSRGIMSEEVSILGYYGKVAK